MRLLPGFRAIFASLVVASVFVLGTEASAVVFDDGTVHVIDAANSFPAEGVLVTDSPGGATTTLIVVTGGVIGSASSDDLVARDSSEIIIEGGSIAGATVLRDATTGRISGGSFGNTISCNNICTITGGVGRSIIANLGGVIDLSGGDFTTLSPRESGVINFAGGSVDRFEVSSDEVLNMSGGSESGGTSTIQEFGVLNVSGGEMGEGGVIRLFGSGQFRLSGGEIASSLDVRDASRVEIRGDSFNLPAGDVATTSGIISGVLSDGSPLSISFVRASTATITLIEILDSGLFRVDQNGTVIGYSSVDDFIPNQAGSPQGPPISDFATARGFFAFAGKFYAVLADGTVVEYPTSVDFANDMNGTVLGTVSEYANDVGFLGATPIPIIAAPAHHPSSLLTSMALLLVAGMISLLVRSPRAKK